MNSKFRFKSGLCVYIRNDISCQRHENLETNDDLDILWINVGGSDKLNLCVVGICLQIIDDSKLLQTISLKVDHIQETFPNAEVVILNVHNNSWQKYSTGLETEAL